MRKLEVIARAQLQANRTGRACVAVHVHSKRNPDIWMFCYESSYNKFHKRKSDREVILIQPTKDKSDV